MPTALIVEDSPEVQNMLSMFLARLGFETIEADDGLQGIKLAEHARPDVILLDLMMPFAPGDLLLEYIRKTEALKNTPVIVTSAHPKAREISQRLGANLCVEKPFTFDDIKNAVQKVVAPQP